MKKFEQLEPGRTYKIFQQSNGGEPLFVEPENKIYFRKLADKHLLPVCLIVICKLNDTKVELLLKFKLEMEIPEKFRGKLHQPISNMFNSYAKSVNKRYGRNGSLFRTRFERYQIDSP